MTVANIRYRRLGYVAINVSNLDASEAFYRDMVGLEVLPERGPDGCRFLRCGSHHHSVVLFQGAQPGLKRLGFEMESPQALDALCEALDGAQLTWTEVPEAERAAFRLGRAVRVVEPHTTATFEFFESMQELAGRPFQPTVAQIQRLGHVVLKTPRFVEAARFMQDVLNFRVSDQVAGAISFMRAFPNPLHHTLGIGKGSRPGLHHINFMVTEVDDIGRAIWRFDKAGVPVVYGPGRHPPSGSMFYYFLDPDGMTVEYSFGMEEFPEQGARPLRVLAPGPESLDFWGSRIDPRKSAVGEIESAGSVPGREQ
ncbi:MAG: VOC family protein [Pigmentiphaga sp.]|uniref:VOC family protein n=1 Tax=Pigmentiphaga sp. TaxID=1977564 RepID=UPI0029B49E7C|nr:VOC family protein [Pigmentiphaga sp.]MDX3906505.1 VOC family protein [Pigmentiphaga sp.]